MTGDGMIANNAESGLSGKIMPDGHWLSARVYFADTDFTGVVYHARYLEFFERGRSDFLRLAGVHHNELADGKHGETLAWVVKRMEIDFRSPAKIDDIITVHTWTGKLSGARIHMEQEILRGKTVLVTATVEAALINAEGKPRRFPKEWADVLMHGGK
jgi:acyl-CoA thioester hydrolase